MTKSRDCKSDFVEGHALRPYNSTCKHLRFYRAAWNADAV